MSDLTPKLKRQLRQAQRTAENNKRTAATQLFREILDENPNVADAWFGLGSVANDVADQKAAYHKTLELEPDHKGAIRALAILSGELVPDEVALPEDDSSGLEDAPMVEADATIWATGDAVAERFDVVEKVAPAAFTDEVHEHAELEVSAEGLVCYKHGNATNLRCYSCGKPICGKCSKVTPVGYRCLDCIRDAESVFFDANAMHYLISVGVGLFLGATSAFIMSLIGFWIIAIFLGSGAGTLIGNLAFRLNGRHRGRYLAIAVAAAVAISGAPFLFVNFLGVGIYLALAVSACYYQLR